MDIRILPELNQSTHGLSRGLQIDFTTAMRRPFARTWAGEVAIQKPEDQIAAGSHDLTWDANHGYHSQK